MVQGEEAAITKALKQQSFGELGGRREMKNNANDLREEMWSTPAKVRMLALTLSEMRF